MIMVMGKTVQSVWLLPKLKRQKAVGSRQSAFKTIMKKLLFNLILSLIILFISGCKQDNSPAPLKFKGYVNNPILVPGEPGSWDDLLVMNACILENNDTIYLFYSGYAQNMIKAVGLATSTDGYHFTKYSGNPIFEADNTGFDAYGVSQAEVFKEDSLWVLYYNARETAGFGMGPYIGRAAASSLYGPWRRITEPVITSGRLGEWDAEFLQVGSILKQSDGSYIMFYSAAFDFVSQKNFLIGMATSSNGFTWKKYNDPSTKEHPFADSDPVMVTGKPGVWDAEGNTLGYVSMNSGGFEMYYSGRGLPNPNKSFSWHVSIGYATSLDKIHWKKYDQNPIYTLKDDPYSDILGPNAMGIQTPKLLFRDSLCLMYYDYGLGVGKISVATAVVK
jgi:predicted GH43/DUF377 family glycosyl hydrolase